MIHRMKRHIAAAAIALASTTPAFAEAPAATPETKPGNPAIWTIEKPNGGTITLFGSVHLLPTAQSWRTPAFTEALAKADVVVFETPIEGMVTPEIQAYLAKNSMNPPGVTLSTLLSAEEKATVEKAAAAVGIPFSVMEPYRPWLVGIQIGLGFVVKQGFDPNAGVDRAVETEAKAAGKALDYFETAQEQLDIFTTMPTDQEKAFLVIGAEEILKSPDSMKDLLAAWASGDVASIDRLMNTGIEGMPELGKKLLEDRNAKWVEKIASTYMADTKSYLIVVGAGHLAGKLGVPEMLRARGIAVSGP